MNQPNRPVAVYDEDIELLYRNAVPRVAYSIDGGLDTHVALRRAHHLLL